jgi:hypothetical protein
MYWFDASCSECTVPVDVFYTFLLVFFLMSPRELMNKLVYLNKVHYAHGEKYGVNKARFGHHSLASSATLLRVCTVI